MNHIKSLILGLTVAICAHSAAQSQVSDMSTVTCAQLTKGNAESVETVAWFSGYYNGLRKNTKVDVKQFKQNAEAVLKACRDNPNSTVMRIVELLQRRN